MQYCAYIAVSKREGDFTMDLSIITTFFANQEVKNFIATYVAEKAMDGIVKYTSNKFSKASLEYELVEALEDSLNETCQHYNWEYDHSAIVETFVVSLNTIKQIDSEDLLKEILENAIGQMIDEDMLNFWVVSFHKQITKPERSWLKNYIIVNHLYNNSKILDVIENKLSGKQGTENELEVYINKIRNNYNVEIFFINTEYIKKIQNRTADNNRAQERFYRVSSNFDVLIAAVINEWDVVYIEALDYIEKNIDVVEGGVLITGNGGMGKTTCMLHVAVQMAMKNRTVIWIDLNNSQQYTKNNPRFIKTVLEEMLITFGEKIYLFIENPFANFQLTQEILGLDNELIKIIVSERINRFEQLLFEDSNANTQYWLEKSSILCMGDYDESAYNWMGLSNVKKIDVIRLYGNKIIDNFKQFFIKNGFNKELLEKAVEYDKKNNSNDISIVEQIYIILNYYIQNSNENLVIKNETKLDWDEWETLISQYTGKNEKYSFSSLAIIYLFKLSLDIPTIAKMYNKSEAQISNWAMNFFHDGITEPLMFSNGMFMLKHDMVAELYFQFNKKMDPIQVLENTIPYLSAQILEKLCIKIFNKKVILNNINFNGFFSTADIIKKFENNNVLLETFEKNNCLVYFEWAKYIVSSKEKNDSEKITSLNNLISKYKGKTGENLLLFEKALFLEKKQDYFKAKRIYEEILGNEDYSECAVQLGHLCIKINYMKQAEKIFKQLVLDNENNIAYTIELCKVYILAGRINDAKRLYMYCIKKHNYNIQLVQDLGKLYIENGEEEEAEKLYNDTLKRTPNSILIYMELGRLYLRQERGDEAEEKYREALNINPEQTQILIDLGRLYIKQERENEALETLKRLKKVKANILEPILELAKLYIKLSRCAEIRVLFYEAKKLGKSNRFFTNLFHYCITEKKLTELDKIFKIFLEIEYKNSVLLLEYGKACEKFNKFEEALAVYLQSFKLDHNLESLLKVTRLYAKKERWSEIDKLYSSIFLEQNDQVIFIENYAKILVSKKEIKKAIDLYQDYLFLNGNDYNILMNLGKLFLLDKDYKNAEIIFSSAIEEYVQYCNPIIELGNLYYIQEQYDKVEKLYVEYLAKGHKEREILLKLAQLYIDTYRPEKAEKIYIGELQNYDDLEMLTRLGHLYLNQKNYIKAEVVYQRAASIDPDYIYVLTGLIEIYKVQEKKDKVNELIRRKNELSTNISFVSLKQSIARYLAENDIPNVINTYKIMITKFPYNVYNYLELGGLYEKIGKKRKAIKIYKRALEIKNDNLGLLIRLGRLYTEIDYDIEIEKTFLKILEKENNNIFAIIELSKYYIKKGRFQDAENILRNIICTNNIQQLTMMGIIYSKKKNFKEAEEKFKDALRINENDIYVLTELGKLYVKIRKYADAEMLLKKALDVNKNDLIVIVELARLYVKMGRNGDAITLFEKALEIEEKSIQVLFTYSSFLYSVNVYDKASILLERLLKEKPNDIQALCLLHDIYCQENNVERMIMVEIQLSEVRVVKRIQELQSIFNIWIKLKKYDNAKQLLEYNESKWKDNFIYKKCVEKLNNLLSI